MPWPRRPNIVPGIIRRFRRPVRHDDRRTFIAIAEKRPRRRNQFFLAAQIFMQSIPQFSAPVIVLRYGDQVCSSFT